MALGNSRNTVRHYANGTSRESLIDIAAEFIRRDDYFGEAKNDREDRIFF
jgi:hypothetical protein